VPNSSALAYSHRQQKNVPKSHAPDSRGLQNFQPKLKTYVCDACDKYRINLLQL
jgi:hypothetical protein